MFRTMMSLGLSFALTATAFAAPVVFQQATATIHQANFGNKDQTIDGVIGAVGLTNGMGFLPTAGGAAPSTIVWETTPASAPLGNGLFTFTVTSNLGGSHTLQNLRFSVTDANRSLFANNLPTNGLATPIGDVLPAPGQWTLLEPISITNVGGATMTKGANHEIFVSGTNPATNVYTITARNPLATAVTGVRLEAMAGPTGSVGRASNGNVTITEFSADFTPGGSFIAFPTSQVNLQNAVATFTQAGFSAASMIDGAKHPSDGTAVNGWAVSTQTNVPQTAVFQTTEPLNAARLVFEIEQNNTLNTNHKLQKFRLSYTTEANPTLATTNWTPIETTNLHTSLPASILNFDPFDSSMFVTGGAGFQATGDIYQIIADGDFKNITGFRLEALLGDNGLLGFGAGTPAGNFVINEFSVFAQQAPEPGSVALWSCLGLGAALLVWRKARRRG